MELHMNVVGSRSVRQVHKSGYCRQHTPWASVPLEMSAEQAAYSTCVIKGTAHYFTLPTNGIEDIHLMSLVSYYIKLKNLCLLKCRAQLHKYYSLQLGSNCIIVCIWHVSNHSDCFHSSKDVNNAYRTNIHHTKNKYLVTDSSALWKADLSVFSFTNGCWDMFGFLWPQQEIDTWDCFHCLRSSREEQEMLCQKYIFSFFIYLLS